MARYVLEPEVAGELGPDTMMDSSVHPPFVSHLQYEIHDWLGDDIIESFPCFMVTKRLGALLTDANLTGFRLESAEAVLSEKGEDTSEGSADIPEFLWLKVDAGLEGDLGISGSGILVISERALGVIREVILDNCDIGTFNE